MTQVMNENQVARSFMAHGVLLDPNKTLHQITQLLSDLLFRKKESFHNTGELEHATYLKILW